MGVLLFLFLAMLSRAEAILGERACHTKKQYAIDMGSTTTKIAIADVRICGVHRLVVGPIERRDFSYDFNDRAKRSNGTFTDADQAQLETLLKEHTSGLDPSQFYGCVATGGARRFANGAAVLAIIKPPCRVIDPITEGRLGFHGISGNEYSGCGTREKVVWDIGGSSSQIFSENSNIDRITTLNLGSDRLREVLAKETAPSKKCVHESQGFTVDKTPNPIGDVDRAITRARQEFHLGPIQAAVLRESCLVGIGKAHGLAIHDQMRFVFRDMKTHQSPACKAIARDTFNEKSYTVNQVRCMADFLSKFNDCELKDIYSMIPGALRAKGPDPKFSLTNVSTLIFALSVLEGNFPPDRAIHLENVSLAEPLLTYNLDQLPALGNRTPTTTDGTSNSSGGHR